MTPSLPRPSELGVVTMVKLGQDLLKNPIAYFERYGDTFAARAFGTEMIMTRDPEWISQVLVKKHGDFFKDKTTRGLSALFGAGLLTSDGAPYRARRKMMQPHFHPQEMEAHLSVFREEANREFSTWRFSKVVDAQQAMSRVTIRSALRTLFGAEPDEHEHLVDDMCDAFDYFAGVFGTQIPLPSWMPTPTNRSFIRARDRLRQAAQSIIDGARRRKEGGSVLARLLTSREAGQLSDEQIQDEVITLLLAGHETSALTLTYTLGLLAQSPTEQDRILAEFQEEGTPQSLVELQRPSTLRSVLLESLRLYPATWAIGREACSQVHIAGHVVDGGTQIYVHQWAAHRHARWFDEPYRFVPSRWQGDFLSSLPKGLFAPFGAGPRICIGQHFAMAQMLVILAEVLAQFRIRAVSPFPPPLLATITARPKEPVLLKMEKREESH